jgi:hypothetical protein
MSIFQNFHAPHRVCGLLLKKRTQAEAEARLMRFKCGTAVMILKKLKNTD